MLGGGQPAIDRRADRGAVAGQQGSRIEPESREGPRPVEPVLARRDGHEPAPLKDVPEDLIRLEYPDDVFPDPGAFVLVELRTQVDVTG